MPPETQQRTLCGRGAASSAGSPVHVSVGAGSRECIKRAQLSLSSPRSLRNPVKGAERSGCFIPPWACLAFTLSGRGERVPGF